MLNSSCLSCLDADGKATFRGVYGSTGQKRVQEALEEAFIKAIRREE